MSDNIDASATGHSMAGQVALVTGATRGIGRAIALALAARGVTVVGSATTEAGAAAITEALAPHGGQGICLNVTMDPRWRPPSKPLPSSVARCTSW